MNFEYVNNSHESFPQDTYTKEVVVLRFRENEHEYCVPYFRKPAKDGGLFWSVGSAGCTKADGTKKYFDCYQQDSKKTDREIREYLDNRRWEAMNSALPTAPRPIAPQARSMDEVAINDDLPF